MNGPASDADDLDKPTEQISHWARLRRAADLDLDDPSDNRIDDYLLLEKIGTGGMGVVYRARQLSLDREVALKLLSFDPFSAEELISRFRTEARHAGRLQHPNIVPVFEIGNFENLYYFSMGLVRGPTLRQWIKANPQPDPTVVAGLMRTIAEAVEYAHRIGILHLDLKPGNVLIDERGEPQVSDFGLARRVGDGDDDSVVAGTPSYMAPEQSLGDPRALSRATDVWGLGGVLYALLTGRPPLDDGAETTEQRWTVTPIAIRAPGVSADLQAICARCLMTDPAARYPSARAVADDLQRFIDGRPVSVRRQPLPERVRNWIRREPRSAALAMALLLAMLVGLAATTLLWQRSEQSRSAAEQTLWDARRATALAAADRGDGLAGLPALVANVGEAEAASEDDEAAADRLRIALLLHRAPRQIDGWQMGDEGRSLAFAEDGRLLLAGQRGGALLALELPAGRQRWKAEPPFPPTPWGRSFVGRIVPTSDGRHAVLFASGSSGVARPDSSHMQRVDLVDGTLTRPPDGLDAETAMTFSLDGRRALLRTPDGALQSWSTDPWQPRGQRFDRPDIRNCLVAGRGDRLACAQHGFAQIDVIDAADGTTIATLAFDDGAEVSSWMLDDPRRLLAIGSARGELLMYELDGGRQQRLSDAAEASLGDLGFSDGVLAASSDGGSVRLLDVERRSWLTRSLRSGAERIGASSYDAATGWLLANDGRVVLWPMQVADNRLQALPPAGILRHRGAVAGFHAVAADWASGRIASQGSEGDLKLFRLPASRQHAQRGVTAPPDPAATAPARSGAIVGSTLRLGAQDGLPADVLALPAQPWSLHGSADGRYWLMATDTRLLIAERAADSPSTTLHELTLPASAQYVLLAAQAPLAVIGWIDAQGPLRIAWRALDLRTRDWLGQPGVTDGLPAGTRLSADGRTQAVWQGPDVLIRDTQGGSERARLRIAGAGLKVTDLAFAVAPRDSLLIATAGRSLILPASVERWQIGADGRTQRVEQIATPAGQARIFDLGDGWLSHGPRPALYRNGQRQELADLGVDWGEAAALSPDQRWAAFGEADAMAIVDLQRMQALTSRLPLDLPMRDTLASLAFSADGRRLQARSHFGEEVDLPFRADPRPLDALRAEAADLVPSRDLPRLQIDAATRRARDPGPPGTEPAAAPTGPIEASALPPTGVDLAPLANVPPRRWFQGSRRGVGISDSAAWPHGVLRLRGIDFALGPAIQLAPPGMALGSASFRSASGPIVLAARPVAGIDLLIANQQSARPGGLRLRWLDADNALLAEQALDVPTTFDGDIHEDARRHQPLADVALIMRSAESRLRGGGSPQLFAYHLAVDAPPVERPVHAIELVAIDATPLLLAVSVR